MNVERFSDVYRQPGYALAAVLITIGFAALLTWSGQVITFFPQGGIFIDADGLTALGIVGTALLLGLTLPLHWFAWRRSMRAAAAQGIGALGALFSVGALSCCAPLLLPGMLGLFGFSGTALLALNLRLHQLRLPLTALALAFLVVSFTVGVRNVRLSCRVRA